MPAAVAARAPRAGRPRAVYIGNAAQTLHPVAGQGLNSGLRDAWDLAQVLRRRADPGDADARSLRAHRAASTRRRRSASPTFSPADSRRGSRFARRARRWRSTALDVLPGPRRFFARRMIYGPSALP